MTTFNWHSDVISIDTPVTSTYKMTQNVRRFLRAQCGDDFSFDRALMAWVKSGAPVTMGDIATEWCKRNKP